MPRKTVLKKKATKKVSVSKKSLKSTIKKIMNADIELKRQERATSYNNIFNVINDARIVSLMPVLSQGVGQGDRIGNVINLKKAILRINIKDDSTSTIANNPLYFDMYIFKFKKNNVTPPTAADMAKFLQNGNGASAYDGNPFAGLRDLNNDLFTLKIHKRFNMIHTFTVNNPSGYGSMVSNKTVKYDISKYIKNVLHFDDNASITPINDNLYVAIGCTIWNQLGVPVDTYAGTFDTVTEYTYSDA